MKPRGRSARPRSQQLRESTTYGRSEFQKWAGALGVRYWPHHDEWRGGLAILKRGFFVGLNENTPTGNGFGLRAPQDEADRGCHSLGSSIRADLSGPDHVAPALGLFLDEGLDLIGCAADRRHVHAAHLLHR